VTRIAGPAAYTDEVARPKANTLALERAFISSTQGEFPARTREPNVSIGQTSLSSKTPAKSVEVRRDSLLADSEKQVRPSSQKYQRFHHRLQPPELFPEDFKSAPQIALGAQWD